MLPMASLGHKGKGKLLLALVISLLVLLPNAWYAHAEEVNEDALAEIRSFADILTIAMVNDSSIGLSEIQIRDAISGLESLQAALHPQFVINGEHRLENVANNSMASQLANMDSPIPIEMELDDKVNTTSGSFTIAKQLGPNAQLRNALEKSTIGVELSVLQNQQAISELALNVQDRYFGVVKAYAGLELAELAVENAKRNVTVIEHKQANGTATMLDVLQEKNALLEAESSLSGAKMGLNVAMIAILQAIGLDGSYLEDSLELIDQWMLNEDFAPAEWKIDFTDSVEYALQHRVELQMVQSQVELAHLDYQAHQEEKDWTVNLTGRYVADDVIFDGGLDSNRLLRGTVATNQTRWPNETVEDIIDSMGSDTNPWQVAVSINYAFGDGGSKKAEEKRLDSAIEAANLQYSSAKDGIYLEVYAKNQQLEQAWRSYRIALRGLEQAEETYKKLELMYDLGSVTEKEVLEAKLYVAQAENQALSSGLDYETQKAQYARALGFEPTILMQAMVGDISWADLTLR